MQRIKLMPRSPFFPDYDLDPQECMFCGRRDGMDWYNGQEGEPEFALVRVDRFQIPWCQWCDHRRRALEWGERNGFPPVDLGTYKIGPDVECWMPAILLGNVVFEDYQLKVTNDDVVWLLIAYIECVESEAAS